MKSTQARYEKEGVPAMVQHGSDVSRTRQEVMSKAKAIKTKRSGRSGAAGRRTVSCERMPWAKSVSESKAFSHHCHRRGGAAQLIAYASICC